MAIVTGLTAAKMLAMEAETLAIRDMSIVSAELDEAGNIQLINFAEEVVLSGNILGPPGPAGDDGPAGESAVGSLVWKGSYSGLDSYDQYDVVVRSGAVYIAKDAIAAPGVAAANHVGTSSGSASTGTTTAVNFPAGTVAGDIAIGVIQSGNASVLPAGCTTLAQIVGSGTYNFIHIFAKELSSGDITTGSITFAIGSADVRTCHLAVFRNVVMPTASEAATSSVNVGAAALISTPVDPIAATAADQVFRFYGGNRSGGGAVDTISGGAGTHKTATQIAAFESLDSYGAAGGQSGLATVTSSAGATWVGTKGTVLLVGEDGFDEAEWDLLSVSSLSSTSSKGYVNHGATAGMARPSGYTSIEWVGSVEPTNAANGDTWVNTT